MLAVSGHKVAGRTHILRATCYLIVPLLSYVGFVERFESATSTTYHMNAPSNDTP